ncbi:MAG TPA: DUF177 domain-containing protein [Acidimicrobiia bacterium]|nr:DUF177 domain-containing protein [Acidimicrobiia bacterium]
MKQHEHVHPEADLRIHVGDLLARPGSQKEVVRTIVVPGLTVSAGGVRDDDPLDLDLRVEAITDGIVVHGHVAGRWQAECSRCLQEVEGPIEADVHELFERHPLEGETYQLGDDEIDLEPLLRDAVVPQIPAVPVCDDACLGLCPKCGVDRNEVRCECTFDALDPRWSALSQLDFTDSSD